MHVYSVRHQVPSFQFITIRSLGETRNQANRRLVRSHALKETLKAKRKRAQSRQENFRNIAQQHADRSPRQCQTLDSLGDLPAAISLERLDPFDSLAADGLRLQTFLGCSPSPFHPGWLKFSYSSRGSEASWRACFYRDPRPRFSKSRQ
jgi:hypothetical protein